MGVVSHDVHAMLCFTLCNVNNCTGTHMLIY